MAMPLYASHLLWWSIGQEFTIHYFPSSGNKCSQQYQEAGVFKGPEVAFDLVLVRAKSCRTNSGKDRNVNL